MVKVLYMSSLNSAQVGLKNFELKDTSKFDVLSAMSWHEYYKKLQHDRVDVIVSGMIFSSLKESFGLFYEHWLKNYSHIPFIIYSSEAKNLPDEFYKTHNVYVVDKTNLENKTLPRLIENLVQLRKILNNQDFYKNPSLRESKSDYARYRFYESYFVERFRKVEEERVKREQQELEKAAPLAQEDTALSDKWFNFIWGGKNTQKT